MSRAAVIISADDFGLSESVNEAIERAARDGILTTASLMVGAAAAADAIERARRVPQLRVGLHLVVIEGAATLPHHEIAPLTDPATNWFPSDQLRLGLRYFFSPAARRALGREIRAQFEAFAATGLTLDHANAHKHMHLHPTIGAKLIAIGREFGLRAVRVPAEPRQAGLPASNALRYWSRLLRAQVRRAGMVTTEHCFGLAWSGHMTAPRVRSILDNLPRGSSEIYFHPGAWRDAALDRLMPDYDHEGELAALLDPAVAASLAGRGAVWSDLSVREVRRSQGKGRRRAG